MSESMRIYMWLEYWGSFLVFFGPVILRYYPYRKRMRIPVWALGLIVAAVWGTIALWLIVFGYSAETSATAYRVASMVFFFLLSCVIIKDRFTRHFFVYLIAWTLMSMTMSIGQFASQRIGGGYLTLIITTLLFDLFTYPIIFLFLRWELEPLMDVDNTRIWSFIWLPSLLTCMTITIAAPGLLDTSSVSYVIIRILLGLVNVLNCVILVICLRHAREQANQEHESARVRELADLKEEFLHNLSHELQMPITVVSGFAQLTRSMMDDKLIDRAAVRDNMRRVDSEAGRLERLVQQLLDAAAIENGSFTLNCRAMDIAELLDTVACVHFPLMDNHDNTVAVDVPPGLPYLYGDQERILQVLLNLMSNAVKHTERGSILLSACLEGNSVAVTVLDTGEGIAPELLPQIFERYPKNRAAGGNGLGLYICAQIVQAHGGQIKVESKTGEGTAVRFTIPVMKWEVE